MFTEITELEETLNALLPPRRLEERPSKELLDAASTWSQAVWKAGESLGAFPLKREQVEVAARLCKHPILNLP